MSISVTTSPRVPPSLLICTGYQQIIDAVEAAAAHYASPDAQGQSYRSVSSFMG